jgi:hypothetical protein
MLDDAGEAVADALGGAAVEAEGELVEIGRQVLGLDRAVMGPEQPALGKLNTKWIGGRRSAASPQEVLRLIGSWRQPTAAKPP